jgi:acyl-CoA synthetase (AMP-forming)/AMP-acid ligase II
MQEAGPETWSRMLDARVGSGDPAVITADGGALTIEELLDQAAGAGRWLDLHQAPDGAPVPAFLPAVPSAFALVVAGAATGRPLAPLSSRFTVEELVQSVTALPGDLLLTTPDAKPVVDLVADRTGRRVEVVPARFDRAPRAIVLDQGPEDIVAVVHTSGTTAAPKAVYQDQGRMARRVGQSLDPISLGPGGRYATASAFHHQAGIGMFLVAMAAGATLVPLPSFSPESWQELARLEPTHATVVPALIEMLLDANALALPTLAWIQYGSSPLHPDTVARLLEQHPQIRLHQQLGQTEGSPITNLFHSDHIEALATNPDRLRSVGRPVPQSMLRIEDPDEDGIGEICSSADHYFGPDPDGWLRTGDLGRVDEAGFVYLSGRKHDVINRGGLKIHPIEVEQLIASYPGIREVAIAGVRDRRLNQVPHAFVVLDDPGAAPDFDAVRAYARARLAGYKLPVGWHVVGALPRNPSGKVLRRVLGASINSGEH